MLRARGGETREGSAEVVDLVGDVVHAGASAREEAPDRRLGTERCEQLDAALADAHRRGLDALLLDARPVLDAAAEQPLVRADRFVEVLDGDADVMDSPRFHAPDAM
jgi:hypothetical protein